VQLDLTSEQDIAAIDGVLPDRLDGLVNNAGVAVAAPMEAVAIADLRHQLEVNVVGQVALTQRLLPRLRNARGRIVFVSSLSGRVATPLMGPYNASKFALEGLADAMRMELWPWGIEVVVVEPAQTDTDMWRGAGEEFDRSFAALGEEHRRLYAQHLEGMRRAIPKSQQAAVPADDVAASIERALTARRPQPRYVVGTGPKVQATLAAALPTRVLDAALRRAGGITRRA
jgi:NAD(P)-dependent dehydrogenase (short-subunit alcohol dehydrogenase family)